MENLFGLEDNEFWSDPWKNLRKIVLERISDEISGIIIAAPSKLVLSRHSTLPLLVFRSGDTSQLLRAPFDSNTSLIIENIETKERVTYEYHRVHERVKKSLALKPFGVFSGVECNIDLFSQGMAKKPGKYSLRVKVRNILSNVVQIVIRK